MTFKIATAPPAPAIPAQYDGAISFRNFGDRAERTHRQIIAAIECCETIQEVEDTLIENDLKLDALMVDFPDYYELVKAAADDHKAILMHSASNEGAPSAIAPTAQSDAMKKVF